MQVQDVLKQLLVKELIEAVKEEEAILDEAAAHFKSKSKRFSERVFKDLQDEFKELQRENESLSQKLANAQAANVLDAAQKIGDITVLSTRVEAKDNNQLRQMMDDLKEKLEKAVIVLGAIDGDKVMLMCRCNERYCWWEYHAGNIVKTSCRAMWR